MKTRRHTRFVHEFVNEIKTCEKSVISSANNKN